MKPTLIHPVLITVRTHKHATGIGKKVCRISKTPVDRVHKPNESKNPIKIRLAQVNFGVLSVLFIAIKLNSFLSGMDWRFGFLLLNYSISFYSSCTVYTNQISKAATEMSQKGKQINVLIELM